MLPTSGATTTRLSDLQLFQLNAELRIRAEIVDRDIKKALNLLCVQIHGQHASHACFFQQIGDELCRDRLSLLILSILPRIPKIGQNGDDRTSRGAFQSID